MKKIVFAFMLLPLVINSQNFSGEITYQLKIIPKSDTIDLKNIIETKHGNISTYVITAKRYKSTYLKDGKYSYSYTYDDNTKRMYDDLLDKPYITYRDSRKANYQYYDAKIQKDSTTYVLGHESYMVLTKSDYGTMKTFYTDDFKVNPEDFEGHKIGDWYNKLKMVNGAISLKTITEFDSHYEVQEAIKIDEREVKPEEFLLPNKPVAASYSALDIPVSVEEPNKTQIDCYQDKVMKASIQGGKKFTSYISFLLEKDGSIKFIEPINKDKDELYKITIDIVEKCKFSFVPGQIEGKPVDSKVIFPVEFYR